MNKARGGTPVARRLRGVIMAAVCMLGGISACAEMDLEQDSEQVGEESEAVTGNNQGGSNLGGANLGGANLSATNLGGANLGGANLAGANQAGANQGGSNLGGNNLGGNNMAATNLAGANLAGANLAGANQSGKNLLASTLSGSTATGLYPGLGCPVSGTQHLGTDLTLSTVGIDIHALGGAVSNKLLRSGEDAYSRTKACVVLGIGSTAMARLVSQNSASATMYAAIKQLPWGFANSSGGALALTAWEVVVWGTSRYAVFIITAPTSTDYAGVAGFVKAIWRWTAPTTKTIKIGQIGGGQTVASYPGMMNAGALFLNGTISEKAYLGGEVGLVFSTTNTQSVSVDFATWVRGINGNPVFLANVAGSPQWTEGVYVTLEHPDGTVEVYFDDMYWRRPISTFGSVKTLQELHIAYADYLEGRRSTKPIPKRCGGWMSLWFAFGNIDIPDGKCDGMIENGYWYSFYHMYSNGQLKWTSMLSSPVLPYNEWMDAEPKEAGTVVITDVIMKMNDATGSLIDTYPIIAETYIHLNEPSYSPYP